MSKWSHTPFLFTASLLAFINGCIFSSHHEYMITGYLFTFREWKITLERQIYVTVLKTMIDWLDFLPLSWEMDNLIKIFLFCLILGCSRDLLWTP